LLSTSLDYQATLAHVCKLAIPTFADGCQLDLLSEDGQLQRIEVAHRDPSKVELIHQIQQLYPPSPDDDSGLMRVLRTGEPIVSFDITDEQISQVARDDRHLGLLRALGLRSAMVIPLTARGRTLGALTLTASESTRRYDEDDFRLALELG